MSHKKKIDDNVLLEMYRNGIPQKDMAKHFGVSEPAISKRLKRILPQPESLESLQILTPPQQNFVLEKAKGATDINAALASFNCTSPNSAKALGHKLMKRNDIQLAVSEVMQQEGLTRRRRVRKLAQHINNADPNISLKALDQSWKLDGAYAPEQHQHLHLSVRDIPAEIDEINAEIQALEQELYGKAGDDETVIDIGPVNTISNENLERQIVELEKELS